MNKQFIYFTSVLVLMMVATLAVPAQENNAALTNTTINNTTLNKTLNLTALNNTTLNNKALNETTPALKVTVPEKATAETSEKTAFMIGSGLQSAKVFQVNGNAKPRQTFEAGLPIKPVRDVSKMVFVCNIV